MYAKFDPGFEEYYFYFKKILQVGSFVFMDLAEYFIQNRKENWKVLYNKEGKDNHRLLAKGHCLFSKILRLRLAQFQNQN